MIQVRRRRVDTGAAVRRSATLSLLLVASLAGSLSSGATRAGADTPPTFDFYGAGYGHGVGMGAWGVYGMALAGWSTGGIINHFYPGTRVAHYPDPASIRVGLVEDVTSIPVQAWRGNAVIHGSNGAAIATIPAGETWTIEDRSSHFWIKRTNGTYVGGHSWGDATHNVYVRFESIGSILYLPQRGFHFNHGFMELNVYNPCGTCTSRERIILQLPTEYYVQGVGEVPATWPSVALHVFAVAARTYVTYKVRAVGQHRPGCNCGIRYVGEQFFIGYNRTMQQGGANWLRAARDTAGIMVLYGGTPIVAAYSTSSGGHSESKTEEWGGSDIPYLHSVCDPGDYVSPNQYKTWEVSMSQATLTSKLNAKFQNVGQVTSLDVLSRSESQRITSLRVTGDSGSYTITGNQFRDALGLRTALVYINRNWLTTGPIRIRYDKMLCRPRLPTSPITRPAGGQMQTYENGSIYSDTVHATTRWLFGLVDDKYTNLGGPTGSLGWPTSGVYVNGNIRRATFQHGTITCNADTGTCQVS
jgi:stage II sporulation protein D